MKRINGIDFARSLALLGMIIVNFKVVFGVMPQKDNFFYFLFSFLEGKAAALFVFIAGLGISLAARKKTKISELNQYKSGLIKKSLVLLIVGLLYYPIWPADILHFYSFYIFIGALFLTTTNQTVFWTSVSILSASIFMIFFFNYETGWNFETLEYLDFWSLTGFVRHIFFNGFHPVFPWSCFLLVGLLFGRMDLTNKKFRRNILLYAAAFFLILYFVTNEIKEGLSSIDLWNNFGEVIFSTSPMPPSIFYVLTALSFSIIVTIGSIEICEKENLKKILNPLIVTGKLTLTHYVLHVLIGMTLVEILFYPNGYTTENIFYSAITYYLCSVIFSIIWNRYFEVGPLERVLRFFSK